MISAFKKILFPLFLILLFQSNAFAQDPDGGGGGAQAQGPAGWWQGVDTEEFAGGEIREAYCDIIDLMEGNFGGMLMAIAGILAFATAAFGDLKHGITALIVGVSSFAIAAMTSLYFGELCGADGNNNARINNAGANNFVQRTTQLDLSEPETTEDPFDF